MTSMCDFVWGDFRDRKLLKENGGTNLGCFPLIWVKFKMKREDGYRAVLK